MRMTIYLFYLLFGYLSGSVLYSYLIPKHFCHVDVRTANDARIPAHSTHFLRLDRASDCSAFCAILGRAFCRCFWQYTALRFRWVRGFLL